MKKSLLTYLFLCFTIALWGQQPPFQTHLYKVTETLQNFTKEINEASEASPLHFHARAYNLQKKLSEFPSETGYQWTLSAPQFGIRVFLEADIPFGDTLFVLDENKAKREYLTFDRLMQKKWNSRVYHHSVILSYKGKNAPNVSISHYSLEKLNPVKKKAADFGDSKPCEVNVNCSEGANYQDVKNALARILIKQGPNYSWCTGTLLNNTGYTFEPYLLTAEHCGLKGNNIVSSQDLEEWVFYFNYESPDCSNPATEGFLDSNRITGATIIARSDDGGGNDGSDFLLLKLMNPVPASFHPYYAGWIRANQAPQKGVVLHHPEGDIKKISTYGSPATSDTYNTIPGTHWAVNWTATTNGHGVTEFGSSGSPLFDTQGLVVGTLTGGGASCSAPQYADYFGKLSYHWNENGTTSNRKLQNWLDPAGTGTLALGGSYQTDTVVPLNFDFVYGPNPVSTGVLMLNGLGKSTEIVTVSIFNTQGKLMYHKELVPVPGVKLEIDVSKWRNAMYTLQLKNKKGSHERKLLITNP